MNPTFGASILSWIPPMWTPEAGLFAIQQASAAGFDLRLIIIFWKFCCLLPWSSMLQS